MSDSGSPRKTDDEKDKGFLNTVGEYLEAGKEKIKGAFSSDDKDHNRTGKDAHTTSNPLDTEGRGTDRNHTHGSGGSPGRRDRRSPHRGNSPGHGHDQSGRHGTTHPSPYKTANPLDTEGRGTDRRSPHHHHHHGSPGHDRGSSRSPHRDHRRSPHRGNSPGHGHGHSGHHDTTTTHASPYRTANPLDTEGRGHGSPGHDRGSSGSPHHGHGGSTGAGHGGSTGAGHGGSTGAGHGGSTGAGHGGSTGTGHGGSTGTGQHGSPGRLHHVSNPLGSEPELDVNANILVQQCSAVTEGKKESDVVDNVGLKDDLQKVSHVLAGATDTTGGSAQGQHGGSAQGQSGRHGQCDDSGHDQRGQSDAHHETTSDPHGHSTGHSGN